MKTQDLINRRIEAKKKYLDLYYQWMETGSLPNLGLCNSMPDNEWLEIFQPERAYGSWAFCDPNDKIETRKYGNMSTQYATDFTPLRQNIVLLMACLNNEL